MVDPMQEAWDPLEPKTAAFPFRACTLKRLPDHLHAAAARTALAENPGNRFDLAGLLSVVLPDVDGLNDADAEPRHPIAERLAVLVSKMWGGGKVELGVSFFDTRDASLQARFLQWMNAWRTNHGVNVMFRLSGRGEVRVAFAADGYWSYEGTDILHIDEREPTMNIEGFSASFPTSECKRVIQHETGHTMGFPHEHMLPELVARLDPARTIRYFRQTQGWTRQTTIEQVLTPLDAADLRMTQHADQSSIMCYQLPGEITRDGRPITGGEDIDSIDEEFARAVYPLTEAPPVEPPPIVQPPVIQPGADDAEPIVVRLEGMRSKWLYKSAVCFPEPAGS